MQGDEAVVAELPQLGIELAQRVLPMGLRVAVECVPHAVLLLLLCSRHYARLRAEGVPGNTIGEQELARSTGWHTEHELRARGRSTSTKASR